MVSVTANKTCLIEELQYCLIRFACYIDCGIYLCSFTSHQSCDRAIERWCNDNLDQIYDEQHLMKKLSNPNATTVGIVSLLDESSYKKGNPVQPSLSIGEDGVTFRFGRMLKRACRYTRKCLPSGFESSGYHFLEYWPVMEGLYRTVKYFATRPEEMADYYERGDFTSLTQHIKDRITPIGNMRSICASANHLYCILKNKKVNCPPLEAFLFVFSGELFPDFSFITEFHYATHSIDLIVGTKQIVTSGGKFLKIGNNTFPLHEEVKMVAMVLEDYKIAPFQGVRYPMKTIAELARDKPRGRFLFSFDKAIYVASHSVHEREQMALTIERFENILPKSVSQKRKRTAIAKEESEPKKQKKEHEENLEAHEFFDDFSFPEEGDFMYDEDV